MAFGSLLNWEAINMAGCSSSIKHLVTWAVWMLRTELDHIVTDDVLRTVKLKQLAETLTLINHCVFVFVKSASRPCNLQPEILQWQPVVSRPLKLLKKGSNPY